MKYDFAAETVAYECDGSFTLRFIDDCVGEDLAAFCSAVRGNREGVVDDAADLGGEKVSPRKVALCSSRGMKIYLEDGEWPQACI